MRLEKFIPELCKETSETLEDGTIKVIQPILSGELHLRVPNTIERARLLAEVGVLEIKNLSDLHLKSKTDQAIFVLDLVEKTMPFVHQVDLTILKTGKKIQDVESLLEEESLLSLLYETAFKIISLGKSQKS